MVDGGVEERKGGKVEERKGEIKAAQQHNKHGVDTHFFFCVFFFVPCFLLLDESFEYPTNLASPLSIIVEASDGASDYGNKFGEPVVTGYARSFGMRLPNNERREWIKPIMFTAGIGMIDGRHVVKDAPSKGMLVVKVGGPCYRIGIGGGAASSRLSTAADSGLDFDAVQRGACFQYSISFFNPPTI